MNIIYILLICIGCYSLLQYVLLPAFNKKADNKKDVKGFIRLKVTGAILDLLKTILSLAIFTYAAFLLIFGIVWILHIGGTISGLNNSILFIQKVSGFFNSVTSIWGIIIFILLTATIILITRSRIRKAYTEALQEVFSKKFEEVRNAFINNDVADLPPTSDMLKILEEIEKLENYKNQASEALSNKDISREEFNSINSQVNESADKFQKLYVELDIRRRITISPDELKPARELAFGKNYILNNDFLGFFERAEKWGFKLGLVLLFLSLISVSSFQMTSELTKSELGLGDIVVTKNKEEAKKRWEATKGKYKSEEVDFSEEDEQLLDDLAEVIETEMLNNLESLASDSGGGSEIKQSKFLLKSYNERNRILERSVNAGGSGNTKKVRANASSMVSNSSMGNIDNLSLQEKDALKTYDAVDKPGSQRTGLKKKIKIQVRNELVNKPQLWNEIKPKIIAHKASQAYSKEVAGLSRKMFSSVLSNSIKVSGFEVFTQSNELGKMAQSLVNKVGTESLENFYELKMFDFLNDAVEYENFDEALRQSRPQKVKSFAISERTTAELKAFNSKLPRESDLVRAIESKPPSINAKINPADYNKSVNTISKIKNLRAVSEVDGLLTITESISSYGDFFAPQQGHMNKTVRGKQVRSWNPQGVSNATKAYTKSFARSRSFVRLRGFSRIGGVLIGHEKEYPENETLKFNDLNWKESNERIILQLVRADGEKFEIGPFRKSLINHALTYVADARPVSVTMITVDPLFDLKILLHPAFIDTRFGCRVIEIDRFVDKYAGSDFQDRIDATSIVESQAALYKLANFARFNALLDYLLENTFDREEKLALISLKTDNRYSLSFSEVDACNKAIADNNIYWKVNNLVELKPEFYDQNIFREIDQRIGSVQSAEELQDELQAVFLKEINISRPSDSEIGEYIIPLPEYQIWSGVREIEYTVDKNLEFLNLYSYNNRNFNNYPLEFMLQVSFTTEPTFADYFDKEDYYDADPFEFDELSDDILQKIEGKIDQTDLSIMKDVAEFTILQRLFRTAFNGGLGVDFPLEKLYQLADTTLESVEYHKTLRWNPKPGILELILLQQMSVAIESIDTEYSAKWIRDYVLEISEDVDFLESNEDDFSRITMDEWNENISFGRFDFWVAKYEKEREQEISTGSPDEEIIFLIHNAIKSTTLARELRFDLNIDESVQLFSCPELN